MRGPRHWHVFCRCVTLLTALVAGCGAPTKENTDNRLQVVAGVPPLAYLVEQIGAKHVNVDVLVQPGQDPHTFEPTPRQVMSLGNAAIFFKIDMPFENVLLDKVQEGNPTLRIVDTTRGIKKREMDAPCSHEASGHEHDGGGEPDPHVWLSPPLLIIQANNVAAALCEADPTHAREYRKNLATLVDRIGTLHRRVTAMLAPYRGRSFYVFHPGFGYFADTYGLKEVPIETDSRSPTLPELRALTAEARSDGVTTIFIQPQSPQQSAQVVADAIGGTTVLLNGLAENVLSDIDDIATKLQATLAESRPPPTTRH